MSKTLLGCMAMWAFGGLITAACGNDDTNIGSNNNGPDGSSTPPPPTPPNNTSSSGGLGDAGTDSGDQITTDGGSNFELDGGQEPDDAGPDGGPCNEVANDAPRIQSDCVSALAGLSGGALVPGKYFLTAVNDFGSPAFCDKQFIPVAFKETMNLAVNAGGTGLANTITRVGDNAPHARTTILNPGTNNSSPLVAKQSCPERNPVDVYYSSGLRNNKQVLRLLLPYGRGLAVYVYEKQ